MASERFKVMIGELPPEEPKKEYTKKEKAKNYWFYTKWYFIGGAIAIIVVVASIISLVTKVKPDYSFGIISEYTLPEGLIKALEVSMQEQINDRNGDGKIVARVNQFNLSYSQDDQAGGDPNIRMANVTRLMGDLQTNESMIFLVEDVQAVQESDGFLAYNDGSSPQEEEKADYTRMGIKWQDSAILSTLPLGQIEFFGLEDGEELPQGQDLMQGFSVVLRAFDPTLKPQSENTKYYNDCFALFTRLAASS